MEDNINLLEDSELINLSKEGSEDATEKLIKKYESLVLAISYSYISKIEKNIMSLDEEVIIQDGRMGILDAIRSFSKDKEASFKTYASTCIRNRVINAIKKETNNKDINQISLDDFKEDEPILEVASLENTEEEVLLNSLLEDLFSKDNSNFSEFERTVLRELLRGLTYTEIANELSKSPKSIDNTIQRIKKKMLKYLKK